MQIVLQSAPFSYSRLSSVPLLTAPPPPKLLCAPHIAGLLPARVPSSIETVLEIPLTREELLLQLGPVRSRAEMNAEIVALMFESSDFPKRQRDLYARSHSHLPQSTVTEHSL